MKVAVYSSETYDRQKLSLAGEGSRLDFTFFEHRLTSDTVRTCRGFEGVCLFVNDDANGEVIRALAETGSQGNRPPLRGIQQYRFAGSSRFWNPRFPGSRLLPGSCSRVLRRTHPDIEQEDAPRL